MGTPLGVGRRRGLGLAVAEMDVTQCHTGPLVAEQPGDNRQRDALHNSLTGKRVKKVMNSHVLDQGFVVHRTPERQATRKRPPRILRRTEDVDTFRSRLPIQDGARRRTEEHPPRICLGIRQVERVLVLVLPAQGQDFALAAAAQQQKADDVRLLRARRPGAGVAVQFAVKAADFLAREETGEFRAGVPLDATRGDRPETAADDCVVQDSAKQVQCPVGSPRRRPVVLVEPARHAGAGDAARRQRSEDRKQTRRGVPATSRRRRFAGRVNRLSRSALPAQESTRDPGTITTREGREGSCGLSFSGIRREAPADGNNECRDETRLHGSDIVVWHLEGVVRLSDDLVDRRVDASGNIACFGLKAVMPHCTEWCQLGEGKVQGRIRDLGLSTTRGRFFSRFCGVHPIKLSRGASFQAAVEKPSMAMGQPFRSWTA